MSDSGPSASQPALPAQAGRVSFSSGLPGRPLGFVVLAFSVVWLVSSLRRMQDEESSHLVTSLILLVAGAIVAGGRTGVVIDGATRSVTTWWGIAVKRLAGIVVQGVQVVDYFLVLVGNPADFKWKIGFVD